MKLEINFPTFVDGRGDQMLDQLNCNIAIDDEEVTDARMLMVVMTPDQPPLLVVDRINGESICRHPSEFTVVTK